MTSDLSSSRSCESIGENIRQRLVMVPMIGSYRYGYPLGFMIGIIRKSSKNGYFSVHVDLAAADEWVDLADVLSPIPAAEKGEVHQP